MATRSMPTVSCLFSHERELELGAHAVGAGHQERILVALGQPAQAGEAAQVGQHLGAHGAFDVALDAFDQGVARVDVHACVPVGQTLPWLVRIARHGSLLSPQGCDHGSAAAVVAMLAEIHALPGAEQQASVADWNGLRRTDKFRTSGARACRPLLPSCARSNWRHREWPGCSSVRNRGARRGRRSR